MARLVKIKIKNLNREQSKNFPPEETGPADLRTTSLVSMSPCLCWVFIFLRCQSFEAEGVDSRGIFGQLVIKNLVDQPMTGDRWFSDEPIRYDSNRKMCFTRPTTWKKKRSKSIQKSEELKLTDRLGCMVGRWIHEIPMDFMAAWCLCKWESLVMSKTTGFNRAVSFKGEENDRISNPSIQVSSIDFRVKTANLFTHARLNWPNCASCRCRSLWHGSYDEVPEFLSLSRPLGDQENCFESYSMPEHLSVVCLVPFARRDSRRG